MHFWLMKSEPDCYGIADLERQGVGMWDGVRNYQVRNMMRDQMKVGDLALFYHSNAGKQTGVAGTMEIVREAYPDPTQFDPKSEHPDPKSDPANPRWLAVDVAYQSTFPHIITIAELKAHPKLRRMITLRPGNRLSMTPVTKDEFSIIMELGNK